MKPLRLITLLFILFACATYAADDIQRFPPPDFESGYSFPTQQHPIPKTPVEHWIDIVILFGALSLSSYFVIRKRSRQSIFYLGIFSLVYFGFIRKGCICSIGAIQNVSLAVFNADYSLTIVAAAFFILPLLFTLFFGRVFCAAVCPLGAIQDLMLIKPVRIPTWLHQFLSILPYVYLGSAVLFAAMGSAFIICEYDPFVSFFRLSGDFGILLFGAVLLAIGMFVGRPYCQYLCPYSVLLKFCGQFSQWRVTVGPDEYECVLCESCEGACPFHQITPPTPDDMAHPNPQDQQRVLAYSFLLPVFVVVGALLMSFASPLFSRMDYTVQLAERIVLEEAGEVEDHTDASQAFWDSGESPATLYAQAADIQNHYNTGLWFLGGFIGLVIAGKLIDQSVFRKRIVYEADRGGCVGCGRCYCTCPLEKKRMRQIHKATEVSTG
jgi:polyferredoxin